MIKGALYDLVNRSRATLLGRTGTRFAEAYLRARYNEGQFDIHRNGEEWVLRRLAKLAIQQPVVWDVGANHGEWSAVCADVVPGATLFAFEPVEATRALMVEIKTCNSFNLLPYALSDKNGTEDIMWSTTNDTTSSISPREGLRFYQKDAKWISIETRRGDDLIASGQAPSPSFVKIDTEGHEVPVLKGLSKTLSAGEPPVAVQFEYGQTYLPGRFQLKDAYDIFAQYKYCIGRIHKSGLELIDYEYGIENYHMSNYLAIRPDCIKAWTT